MSNYIPSIRIWTVGLGVMAIALMGIMTHYKTTESSYDEKTVFEKYRHFFRSEDEQKQIENQITAESIAHACCISSPKFERPESALTIDGVEVTVLQEYSHHSHVFSQYFPNETCTQTTDCICRCKCMLREAKFQAIVKFPNGKCGRSIIRLLSVCKCINYRP